MNFWRVIQSNKQTSSLFPQQEECCPAVYCDQWWFQLLTNCKAPSCYEVLPGSAETARVVAFGISLIPYMCLRGCEYTNCDSLWLVCRSFYHVD